MTTPGDFAHFRPAPSLDAANEDFAAPRRETSEPSVSDTGGWDPYEVWRTRVKSSRTPPQDDPS